MKILAVNDDGLVTDVTEGVQICYDMVRNSMEWGSGLFDTQEIANIIRLAEAAGFPDYEDAITELWTARYKQEYTRVPGQYHGGPSWSRDEYNRRPAPAELVAIKEEIHKIATWAPVKDAS